MKHILGMVGVLTGIAILHPGGAAAQTQCHSSCQALYDVELKWLIGFGCVYDPDANTSCTVIGPGCRTESCGSLALIRDTKGQVLASSELLWRPPA